MKKNQLFTLILFMLPNVLCAMEEPFHEKVFYEELESNKAALERYQENLAKGVPGFYELNKKIIATKKELEQLEQKPKSALQELQKQRRQKTWALFNKRKIHFQSIVDNLKGFYQNPEITRAYNALISATYEMEDRVRAKSDWGPVMKMVQESVQASFQATSKQQQESLELRIKHAELTRDLQLALTVAQETCVDAKIAPLFEDLYTKESSLSKTILPMISPEEAPKYWPIKTFVDRLRLAKKLFVHFEDFFGATPAHILYGIGDTQQSLTFYKTIAELNQAIAKAEGELKKLPLMGSFVAAEQAVNQAYTALTQEAKATELEKKLTQNVQQKLALLEKTYPADQKIVHALIASLNTMYTDSDLKKLEKVRILERQKLFDAVNNSGTIDSIRTIAQNEINLPTKRDQAEINKLTTAVIKAEYDLALVHAQENYRTLARKMNLLNAEKTDLLAKELSVAKRVEIKSVEVAIQRLNVLQFLLEEPLNLLRLKTEQLLPQLP